MVVVSIAQVDFTKYIDHDLEVVHRLLYSTHLMDDNIRVSFTAGEKCAIYKIAFPDCDKKNLMEGTFIPCRQGIPRRPIDDFYHEKGYFPGLLQGQKETET